MLARVTWVREVPIPDEMLTHNLVTIRFEPTWFERVIKRQRPTQRQAIGSGPDWYFTDDWACVPDHLWQLCCAATRKARVTRHYKTALQPES